MNIDKFDTDTTPFENTLSLRLPSTAMVDDVAAEALGEWNSPLIYAEHDKHHFYYDITGRVSLRSRLNRVMTKKETISLFAAIADALLYAVEKNINPKFVILDSDLVYVSTETESLRFICVPAVNHGLSVKSLRSFIRELIVNMQYDSSENLEYIGKIINYLNQNKKLSPADFIDFLDTLEITSPEASSAPQPAAPELKMQENVAPDLGKAQEVSPYPYMIRKKTGERVVIDKDEFKIGKISGMADYLLADNPAVSRMHAIITKIDGSYYICDNYSTNATYLNGEKLESGKNYILLNGVQITFANDEFTYYYDF